MLHCFFYITNLTPGDIYSKDVTFARLCVEAGAREDFSEEIEATLSKVLYRFAAFDSRRWIKLLLDILPRIIDLVFKDILIHIVKHIKAGSSFILQEQSNSKPHISVKVQALIHNDGIVFLGIAAVHKIEAVFIPVFIYWRSFIGFADVM